MYVCMYVCVDASLSRHSCVRARVCVSIGKEELKEYFSELIGTKKRKVEAVVTRSKATPLVKGSIKGFNAFKSLFVLSNSEVTEDLDALKEKTSEKELELHDYAIKRSLIDAGQ
jgi:hypothetical protein